MVTVVTKWTRARDTETSFDDLFVAEYRRVVAIAGRVLGEEHEAEDVAQEVFCSFYRSHPADAPYAAAWLHRAAAHTALNVVRGRKRRRLRETLDSIRGAPHLADTQIGLDPQRALALTEQRREVRAALSRISERSAALLVLRYSGLSYAEIAEAQGIGINQIGTLLRRAETALAKEMTHDAPQ